MCNGDIIILGAAAEVGPRRAARLIGVRVRVVCLITSCNYFTQPPSTEERKHD